MKKFAREIKALETFLIETDRITPHTLEMREMTCMVEDLLIILKNGDEFKLLKLIKELGED